MKPKITHNMFWTSRYLIKKNYVSFVRFVCNKKGTKSHKQKIIPSNLVNLYKIFL